MIQNSICLFQEIFQEIKSKKYEISKNFGKKERKDIYYNISICFQSYSFYSFY